MGVKTLVLYCDADPHTHKLTYEIFSRQGRLLHCVHALIRLWELCGKDHLHYKIIAPLSHFCFVEKLDSDSTPSVVKEVLLSEFACVLGETSPFKDVAALRKVATAKLVDAVEKRIKTPEIPLIDVLNGLKCLRFAGRDCDKFLKQWNPQGAFCLKECYKPLDYLGATYGKEDGGAWAKFKARCQEVFPLMVIKQ